MEQSNDASTNQGHHSAKRPRLAASTNNNDENMESNVVSATSGNEDATSGTSGASSSNIGNEQRQRFIQMNMDEMIKMMCGSCVFCRMPSCGRCAGCLKDNDGIGGKKKGCCLLKVSEY